MTLSFQVEVHGWERPYFNRMWSGLNHFVRLNLGWIDFRLMVTGSWLV